LLPLFTATRWEARCSEQGWTDVRCDSLEVRCSEQGWTELLVFGF
ncbi:hypothetical protein A2U01_0094634, partial [Trifolium medium]|nr:hypothetical protein [Trifolium medium]